jgi:type II secretory pathway pseudopilin PulG
MWATVIVVMVIIAIIGVAIGLYAGRSSKTRWLKQHGIRIIAKVTDSIFSAGTGNLKIIIAEWTDPRTDTTYQFRNYVPTSVHVKLGESVDVLIDPDKPERYIVTSVESISMKKR